MFLSAWTDLQNVYEAVREKVQEEVRAAQRAQLVIFDAAWLRRRRNVAVEVRAMLAGGGVGEWVSGWKGGRVSGRVEGWEDGWVGGRVGVF